MFLFWMLTVVFSLNLLGFLQEGHALTRDVAAGRGRYATQLDDFYFPAERALDGYTNPDVWAGFCAHPHDPNERERAWWMVDLGATYAIESVIIFSPSHVGYELSLGYISVRVSNSADITDHTVVDQCAHWNKARFPMNSSQTLECDQVMYGRYASIQRTSGTYIYNMILCEVKVMAIIYDILCDNCNDNSCDQRYPCTECKTGFIPPECRDEITTSTMSSTASTSSKPEPIDDNNDNNTNNNNNDDDDNNNNNNNNNNNSSNNSSSSSSSSSSSKPEDNDNTSSKPENSGGDDDDYNSNNNNNSNGDSDNYTGLIAGTVVSFLIIIIALVVIVAVVMLRFRRLQQKQRPKSPPPSTTDLQEMPASRGRENLGSRFQELPSLTAPDHFGSRLQELDVDDYLRPVSATLSQSTVTLQVRVQENAYEKPHRYENVHVKDYEKLRLS